MSPAPHDLDPPALTDKERRLKRIQDAAIAFELWHTKQDIMYAEWEEDDS